MKKIECYQILHADEANEPNIEEYVINNLSQGLLKEIKEKVKLKKEILKSGKVKYTLRIYTNFTGSTHETRD
jgi:hypothetical protein